MGKIRHYNSALRRSMYDPVHVHVLVERADRDAIRKIANNIHNITVSELLRDYINNKIKQVQNYGENEAQGIKTVL